MQSNPKIKSIAFVHNDDIKSFHVAIQGTHKIVMTSRINFEDHALIKI